MTHKQQLFIREYLTDCNATRAAQAAGYSSRTAYSIGQRLLKNVEVSQAIGAAMSEREENLIADRLERQRFWTAVMRDTEQDMKHRLRASELLGKSEADFADFVERKEIAASELPMTLADLMLETLTE